MTFKLNFWHIVTGILLISCLFLYFDRGCTAKKLRQCESDYSALYDSIRNAPMLRDTVINEIRTTDTISVPIPKPIRKPAVRDSVPNIDNICDTNIYEDTYNTDLLSVRWRAVVFGELKTLQILPSSSYKFKEITVNKTITIAESRRKPFSTSDCYDKSHLWLFGGALGRDKLQGGSLGLMYTRRGKWGLFAGVMMSGSEWYYQGGLMIKLK